MINLIFAGVFTLLAVFQLIEGNSDQAGIYMILGLLFSIMNDLRSTLQLNVLNAKGLALIMMTLGTDKKPEDTDTIDTEAES